MKNPTVKLVSNYQTHQTITEVIGEVFCGDLVPLSAVQCKHFRGLVNVLTEGKYESPERKNLLMFYFQK